MSEHGVTGATQQGSSQLLGFWMFLMGDAVLFALLFAVYGTMEPGGAQGPAQHYEMGAAFLETLILLASSFTFSMVTIAITYGPDPRAMTRWLGLTLMLGAAFLGLEGHDFAQMAEQGAYPSRNGALSAFFALVSCHGLHVMAGVVWMIVMMIQIRMIGVDARVTLNLRRLGLFWHVLDIIWVGIFSVVYLQGLIR